MPSRSESTGLAAGSSGNAMAASAPDECAVHARDRPAGGLRLPHLRAKRALPALQRGAQRRPDRLLETRHGRLVRDWIAPVTDEVVLEARRDVHRDVRRKVDA